MVLKINNTLTFGFVTITPQLALSTPPNLILLENPANTIMIHKITYVQAMEVRFRLRLTSISGLFSMMPD